MNDRIDTIKALFTYATALVVVAGGLAIIFFHDDSEVRVITAGFVGAALQFLFGQEIQTRTARQHVQAQPTLAASANGGVATATATPATEDVPVGP